MGVLVLYCFFQTTVLLSQYTIPLPHYLKTLASVTLSNILIISLNDYNTHVDKSLNILAS